MTRITIGPRVAHELESPGIGINVNHFMDGQSSSDRPLADAVREMGARYLRFPGGEKSDLYLWSVPPFEQPRPTFARWGGEEIPEVFRRFASEDGRTMVDDVLPFDRFLELCRDTGAEPVVVLPYDAIYKPAVGPGHAPTRGELLATAEGWVGYAKAAAERGLPAVRYWELGNESYMKAYAGWATAADYANDLALWSERLKAIDPDLLLGANGPNGVTRRGDADPEGADPWWKTVLTRSVGAFDFMAIHDYPCWKWGSYDHYLAHEPTFTEAVDEAVACLDEYCSPQDADRLSIAITEMNSTDWQGHPEDHGWKHVNNLGHALVLVDMLGSYQKNANLAFALLWNTRWINNATASSPQLWDAVTPDNRLNASGQAMALWRFAAGAGHTAADSAQAAPTPLAFHTTHAPSGIPAFAVSRGDARSLVLVNKNPSELEVEIDGLVVGRPDVKVECLTLSGEGPDSVATTLAPGPAAPAPQSDQVIRVTIPAYAAVALRANRERL